MQLNVWKKILIRGELRTFILANWEYNRLKTKVANSVCVHIITSLSQFITSCENRFCLFQLEKELLNIAIRQHSILNLCSVHLF